MNFKVRWAQGALNELAKAWLEADSSLRKKITAAANEIDLELEANPYQLGETRPDGGKIHFIYPLGFSFRVEQDEKTVFLLHVWKFSRKKP
jgi:hypothetical protein